MSRATAGLDRIVGIVLGVVLIVGGITVLAWYQGVLTDHLPGVGRHTHGVLLSVSNAASTRWWPWALAGGAVVAIVLGLAWLLAHSRSRGVRRLTLPGAPGTTGGRLSADSGAVLDAAAADLQTVPGIQRSSGRLLIDRRQTVAEFSVTLDPDADLGSVATGIDRTVLDLATALGNDRVAYRVGAAVSRRPRSQSGDAVD